MTVDLPIPASLPADYVSDRGLRLQLYRRLANLRDESEVEKVGVELADRFGPLPRPVENLLYQLRVKIRAMHAGVMAVASENGQLVLTLPLNSETDANYFVGEIGFGARVSKNRIWLGKVSSNPREQAWREQLLVVLSRLEKQAV